MGPGECVQSEVERVCVDGTITVESGEGWCGMEEGGH